jgi:hypothetical protein
MEQAATAHHPWPIPEYWNPPSLFDLAQRTGFDIESLIFGFAFGLHWTGVYEHFTWHGAARPSMALNG